MIKKNANYMKKPLKIPRFKNEDAEREFWAKIDTSEYFEPKDLVPVAFPRLKPSSESISLRLPQNILVRAKEQAHELNIPYQTLLKQYIARGVLHQR